MDSLAHADSFELTDLPIPQRFLRLAHAYLDAAAFLNMRLLEEPDALSYAQGCVCLYLALHSVELFLKGAILSRSTVDRLDHHNVQALGARYHELYADPEFTWDIPFGSEPLAANTAAAENLRKLPIPPADQMFRYPTDKKNEPWKAIAAYIPESFCVTLETIRRDFKRIEQLISVSAQ